MQQRYDIVRSVVLGAVGAVNATPSKSEDQIRDATRDLLGCFGDPPPAACAPRGRQRAAKAARQKPPNADA